jgi:anaerobic ribonucleoside-triphosphate reductase
MKLEKIEEAIAEINAKLRDTHLCEGTAAVYSRISGYYRPVEAWNPGKAEEFTQRLEYKAFN